ncbi:hypothetical protein HFD88_004751 [Aspergillus terreus]|nr:hypothetical protein HFD88_004751 [Aspergillus terreus]
MKWDIASSKLGFLKLGRSEGKYELLGKYANTNNESIPRSRQMSGFSTWALSCLNVLLFLFSLLLLAVSWDNFRQQRELHDEGYTTNINYDLKRVSSFSPIFDEIDLHPRLQKFNGAVNDNSSIFRQDPSPEVDAAWDLISAEGFEITTAEASSLAKAGQDPSVLVHAPASWNRGDDAVVVQIDVFHQIHCLNELRKEIHFDYYYKNRYGDRSKAPAEHMIHKKHCIHILLQNLICHADVDLIPHNWVHYEGLNQSTRPWAEPLADFNAVKKCRDFSGLLEWARETAIQDLPTRWKELQYQKGRPVLDGSNGYFQIPHQHE